MNPNLLWQLMQSMNLQSDSPPESPTEAPDPSVSPTPSEMPQLAPPFDMLFVLRPMLPPREQRMIDIMVKMQELKMLIAEVQNEI